MFHTDKAILVEGKYDKIRLSALTDAMIIETEGFGVFSDREMQAFIKKTAREKGLMIVTDADAAGFRIRNYVQNIAGDAEIVNIYIPDIYGKERRKEQPSKEGKLGVEGMPTAALEEALRRSGAFTETAGAPERAPITQLDLYEAGLSGGENSADRRRAFLAFLELPARLSGNALIKALNAFLTREAFFIKLQEFDG